MYKIYPFKISIITVLISFTIISCGYNQDDTTKVENVILLIGDGMGVAQVYAGMSVAKDKLNIERSQYFGYSKTYSANNYTTDSGAGASAIATGKKVENYSISVDSSGNPEKTMFEYAQEQKISTGIVSTCNLAHATPAAFVAHQPRRNMYAEIASDFLNTKADILIGGGKVLFDTTGVAEKMAEQGYDVLYELDSIQINDSSPVICFVAEDHPAPVNEGRDDMLSKGTEIALRKMNATGNGFILVVEGSQIDWGGHANNIEYVTSEVIDFDKAVGIAFDFADANPGTLVVVTADHETGGLTIPSGNLTGKTIEPVFTTGNHTGLMVPVFAYGSGAEEFSAIMDNTDIFYKIMNALQIVVK